MLDVIEDAYTLACSDDVAVAAAGRQRLLELAECGHYVAAIHLLDVYDLCSGGIQPDPSATDRWICKARALEATLVKGPDLLLAGSRGLLDPRLEIPEAKALGYLQEACRLGVRDAFWRLYEATRYTNPIAIDRDQLLDSAAHLLHAEAMVERATRMSDELQADLAIRCARDLGSLRAQEMMMRTSEP